MRWFLAVCMVALAACGGGSSPTAAPATTLPPGTHVVVAENFEFKPARLDVRVGESVVWEFRQKSAPHNVVVLDGPVMFNSGVPQGSGSFTFTFTVPGTYTYDCEIHPNMVGTVVVS